MKYVAAILALATVVIGGLALSYRWVPWIFPTVGLRWAAEAESGKQRLKYVDLLMDAGGRARAVCRRTTEDAQTSADTLAVAIGVLGRHGATEDYPRVIRFLEHDHPTVRVASAVAMRSYDVSGSSTRILATLKHEEDPAVRVLLAKLLVRDAPGDLVPALLEWKSDQSRSALSEMTLFGSLSQALAPLGGRKNASAVPAS